MFFFNDTATTEIYTLSLHDALPIYHGNYQRAGRILSRSGGKPEKSGASRSEEHTSELQSPNNLVCRLLLDKTVPQTLPRPILRLLWFGCVLSLCNPPV